MTHQILQILVGLAVMVVSALTGWPLVLAILSRSRASATREVDGAAAGEHVPGGDASGEPVAGTRRPEEAAGAPSTHVTPPGRTPPDAASPDPTSPDTTPPDAAHGLRGGLWIGLLERFAATGAVLLGEYTILAAIVAVKGLGRFRELSTPAASERFVVGTLASLTWSVLLGVIGRGLLTLLVW